MNVLAESQDKARAFKTTRSITVMKFRVELYKIYHYYNPVY